MLSSLELIAFNVTHSTGKQAVHVVSGWPAADELMGRLESLGFKHVKTYPGPPYLVETDTFTLWEV